MSDKQSEGHLINDIDVWFSFRTTKDKWAISQGFESELDMSDGSVRFCNILKTRIKVITDVDTEGKPVIETWGMKKIYYYDKS